MNSIKPIRTEADYRLALARVEAIFEAVPGSPEFDELDILGTLICSYEENPAPTAAEASFSQSAQVFHGAGAHFTSGVFSSQAQAEEFINQYRLTGVLTKYPVGISAYDWAIQENYLPQRSPNTTNPGLFSALPPPARSIFITTLTKPAESRQLSRSTTHENNPLLV